MLAVAHRTPRTAAGCRELADLGVTVFEVDLQLLAGVPVVSHYLPLLAWLPRLRHDRWRFTVRARAAAEEDLAAVLDRVPAGCSVLVDLKTESPEAAATVVGLLRAAGPADRWYVSAKDPAVLAVLAAAGHRTWRSLSTRAALTSVLAGGPLDVDAVTVRHAYLDRATVGRLREVAPRVLAWTVRSPRRAAELADAGVDGITADDRAVLAYAAGR